MHIRHFAMRGMLFVAAVGTAAGCSGGSSGVPAAHALIASPTTPTPTPTGSPTSWTQTFPITTTTTTQSIAPIGQFTAVSVMVPGANASGGTVSVAESTTLPSFIGVAPNAVARGARAVTRNGRSVQSSPTPAEYFLSFTPQYLPSSPVSFVALPSFELTANSANTFANGSYEVEATYGSSGVWTTIGPASVDLNEVIFVEDMSPTPIVLSNNETVTLALVGPISTGSSPTPTPTPTPTPSPTPTPGVPTTSFTISLPVQAGVAVAFPTPVAPSANDYSGGSITFPTSANAVNATIAINLSNAVPSGFPGLPGGNASTPVLAATLTSSANLPASALAQLPAASVTLSSGAPGPVQFPNPGGGLTTVSGYCVGFGSNALGTWIPVGAAEGTGSNFSFPGGTNTTGQGLLAGITYGIILYADSNVSSLDPTVTSCQ